MLNRRDDVKRIFRSNLLLAVNGTTVQKRIIKMDTSEEVVARLGFEVLGFPVVSLRGLGLSSG